METSSLSASNYVPLHENGAAADGKKRIAWALNAV